MGWEKLGKNQRKTINQFLNTENKTISDVANATGLCERTVYTYLINPDFKEAMAEREGVVLDLSVRKLLGLLDDSIDALGELILSEDTSDTNRRLASATVINSLQSMRELRNIEYRLAKLERELSNDY